MATNNNPLALQNQVSQLPDDDETGVGKLDVDKLLPILNKSLGWIILFILFSGAAGYLYLRFTRPTYQSESVLKIGVTSRSAAILGKLMPQEEEEASLSGELELIKSRLVYERIVDRLPLDVTYNQVGKFVATELYKGSPFRVDYVVKNEAIYNQRIDLEFINEQEYQLSYRLGAATLSDRYKVGNTYENELVRLTVNHTNFWRADLVGAKFNFYINSRESLVRAIETNLSASIINGNANTILISYKDYSPLKAQDVVNAVDSSYLELTLESKNQVNEQTLAFLGKLLDSVETKLESSERAIENFVKQNKTQDVSGELANVLKKLDDLNKERAVLTDQLQRLSYLQNLVSLNRELKSYLPQLPMLQNSQINELAKQLNQEQMDFENLRYTNKETSTAFRIKRDNVARVRAQLTDVVELTKKDVLTQLTDVQKGITKLESQFLAMPGLESELARMRRRYELNEKLYLLLTEKQADFGIAKAGTVPNFQILSPASFPTVPISPKKGSVYTLWIIIGVIAGLVLVFVRYMLQDTVVTMKELERIVVAPLLGVVPVYTRERLRVAKLVVDKSPKSSLSEALRSVRTNIDFMSNGGNRKRVISVTSTVASEGKTFIALNLSGVMALSNQKVIMLDLDMRKPKLHLAFDLPNDRGMSTVLIGKHTIEECITHTTTENIDVVCAGPPPPNPSELLMRSSLDEVIMRLHQIYDIIVIDSPPVGLVTDGIIIMQKADLPIYVVRSEYSKRIYLKNINKLVKVNGFRNLTVVLNGLDKFKTYGYGYGYGYDYYTDDDVPQGFDMSWFKNLIGAEK